MFLLRRITYNLCVYRPRGSLNKTKVDMINLLCYIMILIQIQPIVYKFRYFQIETLTTSFLKNIFIKFISKFFLSDEPNGINSAVFIFQICDPRRHRDRLSTLYNKVNVSKLSQNKQQNVSKTLGITIIPQDCSRYLMSAFTSLFGSYCIDLLVDFAELSKLGWSMDYDVLRCATIKG